MSRFLRLLAAAENSVAALYQALSYMRLNQSDLNSNQAGSEKLF
ncbi:MAG: hypothetical protein AAF921_12930 [Cyanobacteria bacterium P01_D01_bin.44]